MRLQSTFDPFDSYTNTAFHLVATVAQPVRHFVQIIC